MCMVVLSACISVHHVHAVLEDLEEGVGHPGNGVTNGREQPYGCWELNLAPLEEQPSSLLSHGSIGVRKPVQRAKLYRVCVASNTAARQVTKRTPNARKFTNSLSWRRHQEGAGISK